jgi:hypothetical protein
VTPADRLLKAAHAAIDAQSAMLNAIQPRDAHQYVIRVKPRGESWRASVQVETAEREV